MSKVEYLYIEWKVQFSSKVHKLMTQINDSIESDTPSLAKRCQIRRSSFNFVSDFWDLRSEDSKLPKVSRHDLCIIMHPTWSFFSLFFFFYYNIILTSCQVLELLEFCWRELVPVEGHPYFWSMCPWGRAARRSTLKFVTCKSKDRYDYLYKILLALATLYSYIPVFPYGNVSHIEYCFRRIIRHSRDGKTWWMNANVR